MKRALAVRRWWIAGAAAALVAMRIAIAAALSLLGIETGDLAGSIAMALTAAEVLCLAMAMVAIVAFVQHGRIFRTRIPTE